MAVAAGALLLSATGGAVAADMITGADIKDNTVTTKDIKNETLTLGDISKDARTELQGAPGADGVSGWETVTVKSDYIAAGSTGMVEVFCPAGKVVTGGVVDWEEGFDPATMQLRSAYSIGAYGNNHTGDFPDRLVATVFCATAP